MSVKKVSQFVTATLSVLILLGVTYVHADQALQETALTVKVNKSLGVFSTRNACFMQVYITIYSICSLGHRTIICLKKGSCRRVEQMHLIRN